MSENQQTTNSNPSLPPEFDPIIQRLEESRTVYAAKTKGLFKRAFIRTWIIIFSISVLFNFISDNPFDDYIAAIFAPLMMSGIVGLIFGGIYTLIRKGLNAQKFSTELKNELVTKLVTHINPKLEFSKEGISRSEFNEVPFFRGSQFKSEDSITGSMDNIKVKMAECEQYSTSTSNNKSNRRTYFKGMFIHLEFTEEVFPDTLKIIPKLNLEMLGGFLQKAINSLATTGRFILNEDEVNSDLLEGKDYRVFCDNINVANKYINDRFIKVVDFMMNKYEGKNAFLYMKGNSIYCALEWSEDLFETDTFLRQNLIESGTANKIFQDLNKIDQLTKELLLLNKAISN